MLFHVNDERDSRDNNRYNVVKEKAAECDWTGLGPGRGLVVIRVVIVTYSSDSDGPLRYILDRAYHPTTTANQRFNAR